MRICNESSLLNSEGIGPAIELAPRSRDVSPLGAEREEGKVPVKRLFVKTRYDN
jgi:hypothetical protein